MKKVNIKKELLAEGKNKDYMERRYSCDRE